MLAAIAAITLWALQPKPTTDAETQDIDSKSAVLSTAASTVTPAAAPIHQITDSRGKTIALPAQPQRVVALLPSITEGMCSLSMAYCEQHLVGVDRYTTWPPALIERLPDLGGGLDPNIEAIVRLQPDLVLLSNSSRSIERLEALGLTVATLDAQTTEQAYEVLRKLETLLHFPPNSAETVWQNTVQKLDSVAAELPDRAKGKRVYFEVNSGPYAAGETSFIGELMQRLDAKNVVGADLGPFPKLNPEYIVQANPEVIMISADQAPSLPQRPGWSDITALQTPHVCAFTSAQRENMIRPSPRMVVGIQILAKCLDGTLTPEFMPQD